MRVVRNLDELLKNHLKPTEDVLETKISNLTAPGENFGSIMLRILIKIVDLKTGAERTLDTVGKTAPDSARIQEVFDTQVTFKNEFEFYNSIVPALNDFLKRNNFPDGVDFAAPFHGGRLNLEEKGDKVDENAIILMSNLKSAGYTTGVKTQGLDLDSFKVVLNSLAKFHASTIALRIKQPEVFEQKVKPYFYSYAPDKTIYTPVSRSVFHTLKHAGFTKEEVDKVEAAAARDFNKTDVSELWGSMIHYDTWTNNVLIKYENSMPTSSVLVDFQVFGYGTPLNDVTFFLFTSLRQDFLPGQLDHLLDYYYQQIIAILDKLGIDTKPYSKASFDEEVFKAVKYYEYIHTMWMLVPIKDEQFHSVEYFKEENVNSVLNWSEEHKSKICAITRLCLDKNWL